MRRLMLSMAFAGALSCVPVAGFTAENVYAAAATAAGQTSHKLAGARPFGLGVIIGEPTGISGKYWLSPGAAIDFATAWSFSGDADFHVHADYLFHVNTARQVGRAPIHFFYGAGARFKTTSDQRLGLRIPVGLEFIPRGAPMEIFAELAPILDFIPDTTLRMNIGVGVRYFF